MKAAPVLKFYKHSNDKDEIGWKDNYDINAVGPNLQQAFDELERENLKERGRLYEKEDWSGDLGLIFRRLFRFQNETCPVMGGPGTGGDKVANVYEVVMDSTEGWAQYLSIILKGEYNKQFVRNLEYLDFAPKHSYLAKGDGVAETCSKEGLWLNSIRELGRLRPR